MRALSICKISGSKKKGPKDEWYYLWQIREFYIRRCSNDTYAWSRGHFCFDKNNKPPAPTDYFRAGYIPQSVIDTAKQRSEQLKIPFIFGIYSGLKVEPSPVEMLAITHNFKSRRLT